VNFVKWLEGLNCISRGLLYITLPQMQLISVQAT